MVAILTCGPDVADRLERRAVFGGAMEYSEAWRSAHWQGASAHLVILIDEDTATIRWLGRVQGGRRVTSRDRAVKVSEIVEIDEPPALGKLRARLHPKFQEVPEHRGVLSPAAGEAAITALRELLAPYAGVIDHLNRPTETRIPRGPRGELLNQERDAVGMLLEMAGVDRTVLRSWYVPPHDAPFLEGMSRYVEREDALIEHDIRRFGSWARVADVRVAWQSFVHGRRRIFVMNANRSPVEHTLGVDVVYYNEDRGSFVLVQYKKMRPEPVGVYKELFYRPDEQLRAELLRMEAIDELCRRQPGEFRLLPTASWLKLCDPDPRIEDPAALIKGMYFAREHFLELMQTCKGPKGGVRIGYSNVPRHLNNTDFTGLVRDGWIGSRGPASDEIGRLVRESLETGHAVAVGVGSDLRSRQRSP